MDSDGRNGDPRPFSTDELENYTGDWSLSCDMRVSAIHPLPPASILIPVSAMQLLSNFKSISGSMFDRADHVMAALNDISYKTQVNGSINCVLFC